MYEREHKEEIIQAIFPKSMDLLIRSILNNNNNEKEGRFRTQITAVDFMIKNMLTKRKESDTYLATVSRHRWSRKITIKIDKM